MPETNAPQNTSVGDISDSNGVAVGTGAQAVKGDGNILAGGNVTINNNYAPVPAPANASERRARQNMLANQRSFWIDGLLKHSLWNESLITLGLATRESAVQRPYDLNRRAAGQTDQRLPADERIITLYDAFHGSLLILGAPGSGKTTLLLELLRDLIERADVDETYSIPVRFDLSAWGKTQPPMQGWLAEQLTSHYQVPRKLATTWMSENRILPLLDGLDEVATERRSACVDAINMFQAEDNGLLPLVVCCREQEYADLPILKLRGAAIVQPLSDAQIEIYLAAGGVRLNGVRALIADDPALIAEAAEGRRLLATPLILSVVNFAYADVPRIQLHGTTLAQRRAEILTAI